MTRRLVYTTERLDELPVGAVVQAHRRVSGLPGEVQIIVRQPDGWFGAWAWQYEIDPALVIPCTVLSVESVQGGPRGVPLSPT